MSGFVANVILYHTTAFGNTEQRIRSAARAEAAALRVRAWLAAGQPDRPGGQPDRPGGQPDRPGGQPDRPAGLVLTGPAAVAWACGGIAPPVDRTAAVDLVWAVVTADGAAALITTTVEADRIRDEYGPAAHGFSELAVVPWQDPAGFVTAAESLTGAPAARLASDGHPAFGLDASD